MKVIDATLARRDKAMAAMRSLQESLQELLFMKALVWLVSANGKDEKCENAYHFAGCSVRYKWRRLRGQQEMPLTNLGERQPATLEFGKVLGEDGIHAVAGEPLVWAGFQHWNR